MDIKNELVWSHSRGRAFHDCKRAYWFNYYGYWMGWDAGAPAAVRETYLQKKLTSRAMWTGTVVHGIAEAGLKRAINALASGEARTPNQESDAFWTLDDMRQAAFLKADADIRGSASGEWKRRPAKRTGFTEHYYDLPVSDDDWKAVLDEIDRQVVNLHANRIYRRLLVTASRIREVEELRKFAVGSGPECAEVYLAVDAMVGDGNGGVVIIDWKTGQNHEDAVIAAQLGVYGLYATQELGIPEDRITAMHVNLRHNTEARHPVGPAEIAAAREAILTGMAEMRASLKDVAANIADKEDFPTLPEGSARCRWCNFRRSCGRE